MTRYRGHFHVDGGVTNFVPKVPEADYTVRVSHRGGENARGAFHCYLEYHGRGECSIPGCMVLVLLGRVL